MILKVFGKLRGGVYFINPPEVLQKVTIRNTKHCLNPNVELDNIGCGSGHSCIKCGHVINGDQTIGVFHNCPTPSTEVNVLEEVKLTLICIAGYVVRKYPASDDSFVQEYWK